MSAGSAEDRKMKRELRQWNNEKKIIPEMVRVYCHGKHGTKGKNICEDCKALTEYALFRLDKCPFKVNKHFCNTCKIHCYKPEERAKIKDVMRYAGPKMLLPHPIFSIKHVVGIISMKREARKLAKNSEGGKSGVKKDA